MCILCTQGNHWLSQPAADGQIHVFINLFSSGPQGSNIVCNLINRQMLLWSAQGKVDRRERNLNLCVCVKVARPHGGFDWFCSDITDIYKHHISSSYDIKPWDSRARISTVIIIITIVSMLSLLNGVLIKQANLLKAWC